MQTTWQWTPPQNVSNEDTDIRTFQRTRSAQYTLEQAQTLLQQTTTTAGTTLSPSNDDVTTGGMMECDNNPSQSSSQSTLVGTE